MDKVPTCNLLVSLLFLIILLQIIDNTFAEVRYDALLKLSLSLLIRFGNSLS